MKDIQEKLDRKDIAGFQHDLIDWYEKNNVHFHGVKIKIHTASGYQK